MLQKKEESMRIENMKGYWALVTGASSGIGREYAKQLALAGANLVLVARRAERLKNVAQECLDLVEKSGKMGPGIEVIEMAMDLTQPQAAHQIQKILHERGVKIRLLVNNAAVGQWSSFEKGEVTSDEQLLQLNMMAVVEMTRVFLPDLLLHPSGGIINVSSQAAYNPMPWMSLYGASKAFVHNFSLALSEEFRGRGLWVQTLVPGPTRTEIIGSREDLHIGDRAKMASPDEPVRLSLARMGKGSPLVIAAKGVFLQRLFSLLPVSILLKEVAKRFQPPQISSP